jgi:ATP-dependent DNA ligase
MNDRFALPVGYAPMEAKLVAALPDGAGWQFEPKWDGFRCLAFRNGDAVEIMSKSGKPLGRFFPEVVAMLGRMRASQFVLDGELTIAVGEVLAFDALQARLHPAESRISKLSRETPAQLMLFDCLALDDRLVAERPLTERRRTLENLLRGEHASGWMLSPKTGSRDEALAWLERSGGALDGVIAKRSDDPYRSGERAMLKVKQHRSADCVVGGFRYEAAGGGVASLLLGLYDEAGLLNHVGFTSGIAATERQALSRRLEPLIESPGFTGKAPGGPSRWATDRSRDWQPLRPELVVEVVYDQATADRFRHGTRLLRWRADKAPRQCMMDQLTHELKPAEICEMVT